MERTVFIFFVVITFFGCNKNNGNSSKEDYPVVLSVDELRPKNQNDTVNLIGYLQKWKPWGEGKGGGTQYFEYKIFFSDSTEIPVTIGNIIDNRYQGQLIELTGVVVEAPIHKRPCPPYCQNTTEFWQLKSVIEIQLNIRSCEEHNHNNNLDD